jgi:hypothetical protein
VLAPLFIGAGDYILISRLYGAVQPTRQHRIFGIPTAKLTRIFVLCDVLSFLVQASGSAIASSGNWKGSAVIIGTDVLIAGLATQVATFAFFMAIVVRFHVLTRRERDVQAGEKWRKILFAVYVSSILIIVSNCPTIGKSGMILTKSSCYGYRSARFTGWSSLP